MNIKQTFSNCGNSLKSIAKIMLQSRHSSLPDDKSGSIVILGNGPSLNHTIDKHMDALKALPLMAVNFAANADVFFLLRPQFYLMVDPVFFGRQNHHAIPRLIENLAAVTWPMVLIIPNKYKNTIDPTIKSNPNITVATINTIGVNGWQWLENMAYSHKLGMPRPRNVLIPAIMSAMSMGFDTIYITGADHSWMRTISVDDNNHVISVQPHFYKDRPEEQKRINTTYQGLKLHQVVHSFYVAFESYHHVARYASHKGIDIINSTPGSFIDAFRRAPLPQCIDNDKKQQ